MVKKQKPEKSETKTTNNNNNKFYIASYPGDTISKNAVHIHGNVRVIKERNIKYGVLELKGHLCVV